MAVTKNTQRTVVELAYDKAALKGKEISVEVGHDEAEVRTSENDGLVNVTFPSGWKGSCDVTIRGSGGGEETGTVEVD